MPAKSVLGYVDRPGFLHRVSGLAKLMLAVASVVGALVGFDARYLAAMLVLNIVLWVLSRVKLRDLAVVLVIIAGLMLLNNLFIFLFAPGYGTELYGTRTVLVNGPWHWDITREQLFYQLVVTLKYFAVLPPVLLFIATTRPPEFAQSLNRIGVPYKIAYSVSIALRYIPDIQRDFVTISKAHQARGLETSSKAGIATRARNIVGVIIPLLLGAFDRIEEVASAMELRGFGRGKRRTWYGKKPLTWRDGLLMALSFAVLAVPIVLAIVNGGRFWNPFA